MTGVLVYGHINSNIPDSDYNVDKETKKNPILNKLCGDSTSP